MTTASKRCAKCHVVRSLADYYSDPTKKDGKHTVCRICKTKSKGAVRRGPDPSIPSGSIRCNRCDAVKLAKEFHKSRSKGFHGVRQPCKQCRRKTDRSLDNRPRFRCVGGVDEVRCTKCDKWLPPDRFSLIMRTGKLCAHCKQCKVDYTKTWTSLNRDKVVRRRLLHEAKIREVGSFTNNGADRQELIRAIGKRYAGYVSSDTKRLRKRLERKIHGLNTEEVKARLAAVRRVPKVSIDQFLDFVLSKAPVCECCRKDLDMSVDSTEFAIDHFHDTGRLRGLLCNDCNLGIGSFQDSVAVLEAAKKYLELHHAKRTVSTVQDK